MGFRIYKLPSLACPRSEVSPLMSPWRNLRPQTPLSTLRRLCVVYFNSTRFAIALSNSIEFNPSFRRDESGIKSRELGVMFKDLRVTGLGATASFQPTLGSMFNPKVIMENIENARHPHIRDLLTGFEGVVRPGEMLCIYIFHQRGLKILTRT